MSKAFWQSKTVLAAIVAVGCVAYQLYTGAEPGADVQAAIQGNASQVIELVSLAVVIWGRATASGPLSIS